MSSVSANKSPPPPRRPPPSGYPAPPTIPTFPKLPLPPPADPDPAALTVGLFQVTPRTFEEPRPSSLKPRASGSAGNVTSQKSLPAERHCARRDAKSWFRYRDALALVPKPAATARLLARVEATPDMMARSEKKKGTEQRSTLRRWIRGNFSSLSPEPDRETSAQEEDQEEDQGEDQGEEQGEEPSRASDPHSTRRALSVNLPALLCSSSRVPEAGNTSINQR